MKIVIMKYVKTMLYGASVLLSFFLPVACQSDKPEEGNGPFDPDARIESSLGDIALTSEQVDTRAATYKPLGEGETFRLYALKHGVTDMQQVVTSYAYTMKGGKPIMDAGQGDGKLYLPYGDLDIYLVGPVSVPSEEVDADGKPVMLSVAAPTGVIPRQGVDLIASCTPVAISYTGTNKVNPVPLKHKMAKVRVRVNRNSDKYILMKYLKLTKVELYNQYSGVGVYTFGADGGTIAPLAPDSVAGMSVVTEGSQIKHLVENKEYYADFMLLPRQAGYQKIETEMDITLTDNEENPYRMSGITRNIEFVGGKQNLLFTEPEVSNDIVWRPTLLPWDEEEPIAAPMGGDMVVYLDGRDAPETINGKLCWRDRSGNGNHAEIPVSSGITYNAERMCYEFATASDKMQLPDLGSIPEYTLEIVAQSMPDDGGAVQFQGTGGNGDGARCLYVHLPYTDNITHFDSGYSSNSGRISTTFSSDPLYYHSFHTYYFQKSTSGQKMVMGVNGVQKTSGSIAGKHGLFTNNTIGGKKYLKIRSLRLYRKMIASTDIAINYNVDKTAYREEPNIATNGLILNLDGKLPPITWGGETYWADISGGGHHAKYIHFPSSRNHIVYTGRGYRFNNVNAGDCSMMTLVNSLGTLSGNAFTLEIVTASEDGRSTIFHTGPVDTKTADRTIGIHLPFPPGAGTTENRIVFDGPRYNDGTSQNRITYTGPYVSLAFTSKMHYYAFTRSKTLGDYFNRVIVDGQEISRLENTTINLTLQEMKYTYIGNLNVSRSDWFIGEICAIRLYNRALTPAEILTNSRADKARYKY